MADPLAKNSTSRSRGPSVAGPQIVTATFLATSQNPRRNSLAFLAAVGAATPIGVTVFFLFGSSLGGDASSGRSWEDWLERTDARFAAKIGFLLDLVMPTDLISMATVGTYLARHDEPWWHSLGFIVLTVLVAGLPLIALLVMGVRSERTLPRIRQWMNDNSWIVNEGVLVFFLLMTLF